MRSDYKLNMNLTFEPPVKVAYGRAAVKLKCQVHSWAGLPKLKEFPWNFRHDNLS